MVQSNYMQQTNLILIIEGVANILLQVIVDELEQYVHLDEIQYITLRFNHGRSRVGASC